MEIQLLLLMGNLIWLGWNIFDFSQRSYRTSFSKEIYISVVILVLGLIVLHGFIKAMILI